MCNLGGILNTLTGGLLQDPAKEAEKATRRAEAARLAQAEQVRQEEEAKRKKKRAERIPVETIIAGESGEQNLGA